MKTEDIFIDTFFSGISLADRLLKPPGRMTVLRGHADHTAPDPASIEMP